MPAQPISIGPMHFKKKGDAVQYLKEMLKSYNLGDRVKAEDAAILRAALEYHPDAESKIGCGIAHFSVRTADFGTKCFWINRSDGTTEKFSISSTIYSKKTK